MTLSHQSALKVGISKPHSQFLFPLLLPSCPLYPASPCQPLILYHPPLVRCPYRSNGLEPPPPPPSPPTHTLPAPSTWDITLNWRSMVFYNPLRSSLCTFDNRHRICHLVFSTSAPRLIMPWPPSTCGQIYCPAALLTQPLLTLKDPGALTISCSASSTTTSPSP